MTQRQKLTKGTMTDITLIEKPPRPAELKPTGKPRQRKNFAEQDKQRQSDLTDQEIKLARRMWTEHIEPLKEEFVSLVFEDLFTRCPDKADLLLRLEVVGLPRLHVPGSIDLNDALLARTMVRLRHVIDLIDQPDKLTKLMTRLGVLVAKTEMVDAEESKGKSVMWEFQKSILATIKLTMNNQLHPKEETALKKCFELAFSIMEEASFAYYDLFLAQQPRPAHGRRCISRGL